MAPASSTPVGPPPTMTNVSRAARRAGSVSRSARSSESKMRRRIDVASSSVLSPGAILFPLIMTEVGMPRARGEYQRVVSGHSRAVLQRTVRCSESTPLTTPSKVVTSRRLRTRCRIGHAISEVASVAVPT